MGETDEYDLIFSALKHPVRRQILLFLDHKGEASFAEIQKDQGIDDTGLLSYHLKELAPLVKQSMRGRYCLSETGRASLTLFRKVEAERESISGAVHREMENLTSRIVYLFLILGGALVAPLSADIYFAIQSVNLAVLSIVQITMIFLAGLVGMILSLVLFVVYDLRYSGWSLRKNVVHALLFAVGVSVLLLFSAFVTYNFQIGTMSVMSVPVAIDPNIVLILGILRATCFIGITPVVTHLIIKRRRLRK